MARLDRIGLLVAGLVFLATATEQGVKVLPVKVIDCHFAEVFHVLLSQADLSP
jgi:hypothetical protein